MVVLRIHGFAVAIMAASSLVASEWRPLLDRDLAGWRTWLGRPHESIVIDGIARDESGKYAAFIGWDRDPLDVFRIVEVDGGTALSISGRVFGTLVTDESFSNFHLRCEFRWGERRWAPRSDVVRDSGLLYHVHQDPGTGGKTWPPSVEMQIQEGDTGDLWAIQSRIAVRQRPVPRADGRVARMYDRAGDVYLFSQDPGVDSRCIKGSNHENPSGVWNTVELICLGDESIHIVNGHVVMRLHALKRNGEGGWQPLTGGRIALQSEGAEIFFRRIEVRSITEVPPEFADTAD